MHLRSSQCSNKTRFLAALLAGLSVISPCQWLSNDARALPVAPALSIIFKAILKKALFVGLNKAGQYFLKSAWPYAKIVIEPLIEKFPDIISKNPVASKEATDKALMALDNDQELLEAIEQRFNSLEHGQIELLEKVRVIEATLENHEERIRRLEIALRLPKNERLDSPFSTVTTEFSNTLRAFLDSARKGFQNIKGSELFDMTYESKLVLPGATSCVVNIGSVDVPGSSSTECRILDSDLHENVTPELTRFTFVEVVEKIIVSLPSSWKFSYPGGWKVLKGLVKPRFEPITKIGQFLAYEYPNQQGVGLLVTYRYDKRNEKERQKPVRLFGGASVRDMVGPANRVDMVIYEAK